MGWEADALEALAKCELQRLVQLFDGCTKRLAARVHRTPAEWDSDDEAWDGGRALYNNAADAEVPARNFGRVWKGDSIIELTVHCLRLQDDEKACLLSLLISCGADSAHVKSACELNRTSGAWVWRNVEVKKRLTSKTSQSPLNSDTALPPSPVTRRAATVPNNALEEPSSFNDTVSADRLRRVRKGLVRGDYYQEWFSSRVAQRPIEQVEGSTSAERLSTLRARLRREREKVEFQRSKIEALEQQLSREHSTLKESMIAASRITQQIRSVEENRDRLHGTYDWTESDSD